MKTIATATAALFITLGCSSTDKSVSETGQMSNKEKVVRLLKSIETGEHEPISYINAEKYTQHNLMVKDGLVGFGELMAQLPQNSAKVNTVRSFQDGDYVFTHTEYEFFGPKAGFDVFRFEDGLIVEHWDNLAELAQQRNPSGRTQLDGPVEIADLEKTDANKLLVQRLITEVLIEGKFEAMAGYFDGDNYLQHNTHIGDGLSGLSTAIQIMAKQGIAMEYRYLHKVVGEGNFVLAISEGIFAEKPTSFYDLFRIENGKIAEHWDVIEKILPKEDHQNTNGKFNFK
ncbi:MAG: hypothetical protein OCD01_13740 [Fibrobacterales bacterium]